MMQLKSCTQYVSKIGKLIISHRTGKGQFSFQSQRRAMSKNVQTTIQLHLIHMLVRLCSKFFKRGFSTMNWKLSDVQAGFQEAEEPEFKSLTFSGSWRKQGYSRKTSTSTSLTMLKPLIVWITRNRGKFLES